MVLNTKARGARLPHIRELDGIRGIAAVVVFLHHICFAGFHPRSLEGWGGAIRGMYRVSAWGGYGVDLFFVLSGFLITSILLEERGSSRYYQDFYWKRALRILPLYVICLAGLLVFTHQVGYVLMAALFVANFASAVHVVGVGPFWTLAIEEQFYLLWPSVVRRRDADRLLRWAVGVGLTAVVLRVVAAMFGKDNYDLSFLRCDGLAFGAGLACLYRRRTIRRGAGWMGWMVGIAGVGALLMGAAEYLPWRPAAMGAAAMQTGVTLLSGAAIGLVIALTGSRGLGWLRWRGLTFFGLISYAFYMIHLYVIDLYDHWVGALVEVDRAAYWVRFGVCLGVTVALCVVSRYALELPAMNLRRYVLKHPAPASADVGSEAIPLGRMD